MAHYANWRLPLFLVSLLISLGIAQDDTTTAAAGDPSVLISEIARASNQSLLWGPYKPNLYFGVRPRIPKSLSAGLLWAKVDNFQDVQGNFRHTCEQHDGLVGYGWDEYDVRRGGQQTIHDDGNKIDLSTSFVKIPGGAHGGSWGVRVKGVPREDAPEKLMTTVIFYATLEGIGLLEVENAEGHEKGFEDDVVLKGRSQGLGDYKMVITKGKGEHPGRMHKAYDNKPLDRTIVHSAKLPEGVLWQIKPLLFKQMKDEIDGLIEEYTQEDMPPPWQVYTIRNAAGQGNLHFVQKVFEGPFEFDVLFSSESSGEEITSEILEKEIESTSKSFGERFKSVFSLAKEFDTEEYEAFAKNMFSNLFGGIGYFQGNSVVDRSYAPEYDEENEGFWEETAEARGRNQQQLEGPSELFTSIPSRPFFPRGFFWDEGFHLLPISDWDMDVSLEIVKSWFNLMDEDGWIGREQILGDEARSKVPAEFQVQYPHYANPPTLYLILDAFIERLSNANNTKPAQAEALENSPDDLQSAHLKNPEAAEQYLRSIYPLLKKQWSWFRRTQAGDLTTYDRYAFSSKEGYRWRGRTVQHILTSGLDDYPRPQPPHPGELHVDLLSWMGVMTKSLHNIATYLEETEDAERFASVEKAIIHNLDDLHWSDKDQCYCDATVDEFEENKLVCHKGYISLFPFLTGLLSPDSPRLEPIMDLIADPEELWSEYGIRSLSKKDEFYGTDENYWRGPIWMPMNYLIVKELLNIAQTPTSPYAARASDLYTRLRRNLVDNVYRQWKATGFAWEQYNPEDGHGQRTQHFTGWTSLVVKLMGLPDLKVKGGASRHDEL